MNATGRRAARRWRTSCCSVGLARAGDRSRRAASAALAERGPCRLRAPRSRGRGERGELRVATTPGVFGGTATAPAPATSNAAARATAFALHDLLVPKAVCSSPRSPRPRRRGGSYARGALSASAALAARLIRTFARVDRRSRRDQRIAASTNSGDINPASDRPCESCNSRTAFTISSAVCVQGGNTRSLCPSGVVRWPHFTSSEQ